jgi:hypothetical protein
MRRGDLHRAGELRIRLERAGGAEWVELTALRSWFGGKRLSKARRHRIMAALLAERIDVSPSLLDRPVPERVRLEVLPDQKPLPGSRPRVRAAWIWLRANLFTPVGAAVGFAASVVTLGLLLLTLTATQPPPARMSGDLNVAVAAFTTDGTSTEEGVALAREVKDVLGSELPRLDPSLQVEVRGPTAIGSLDGPDAKAQARAAKKLAQSIGADIVVFGDLAAGAQGTRLRPAFYLNATKLPWARALGGGYAYGGPIALPYALSVSPPARASIRAALIRRTEAYAQVFIGVGYYLLHELPRAQMHLHRALARAPTLTTAALLRLLLGNIADQQGHTGIAARNYSLATRERGTRRRAELGLADVRYQLGHARCRPGESSPRLLNLARQGFSVVLHEIGGDSPDQIHSPLAAKAAFGEGQVDLCLSAAGQRRRWPLTRKEFTAVIQAYRPSLPELRDDVAEAHAGLGLYFLSVEQAPIGYEDAKREYSVAAGLTTLRSRRSYFARAAGFAAAHLRQYSPGTVMREQSPSHEAKQYEFSGGAVG